MSASDTPGLLLINLGTTSSPSPGDVRRYLREFLSDPRVIDGPAWKRKLIVELFILPTRPRSSGEAYAKIWTDRGSPLLFYSRDYAEAVQERLGDAAVVELAMRYGRPSIAEALGRLRDRGVGRIIVFPLYPQYSSAATASTLEEVASVVSGWANYPSLVTVPPFYDHPAFIDACARVAAPVIRRVDPERVFLSFHGLPERHMRASDATGAHCLCRDDCCERIVDANRHCYRAQCYATGRLLADRLEIPEERRVICFQSRLGRTPWIRPYTDEVLVEQARAGCRRAVILSPAFVADCLETLEELGIRAAESWRENGGEVLELVPSLNASEAWVAASLEIVRDTLADFGPLARAAPAPGGKPHPS
jgi:ferrochelatase